MSSLPFQLEQPFWLLLPIFVVSVVLAVFLYYRKNSEFSKSLRFLLAGIRFLVVFLLGFLLLNVFFFNQEKQLQKPILAVVVDESESMLKNADSSDLSASMDAKFQQFKNELEEVYQIDFLSFHQEVVEQPKLEFSGKRTDLAQVFKYLNDKYYMLPLEAAVVFTDGQNNQGLNPLYQLEAGTLKVYPVVMGDTLNPADAFIDQVFFNKVVKQKADFYVDVVVQAQLLKGENISVQLKKRNRVIAEKEVKITSENESREIRFELNEPSSGLKRYAVEVVSNIPEKNLENNSSDFYIQVVESGQKVLIVGNNPHPDLGAIASALRTIDGLEVEVKTLNDYPFQIKEEQLIILHGLPSDDERSKALLSQTEIQRKALWYIWTISTDINHSDFPFFVDKVNGYEYAEPLPVADFNDFLLPGNWKTDFSDYPPLYTPFAQLTAKYPMSIFFTQRIRGYESGEVLWSFWDDKGMTKSYLAGEGIWKWKLYNFQQEGNHFQFNDLIKRVSKYLLTGAYNDRFNLQFQSSYNETDRVLIEAQVLNKAFENINTAEVSLRLKDEQQNEYPYQFSSFNDRYGLDLGFLKSGIYSFVAQAKTADSSLFESGTFVVESWDMEASRTGAQIELLHQIASLSNGKTYAFSQTSQLISDLKQRSESALRYTYIQKIFNLIDIKWLLLLLVLMLAAEWFLRKYFGSY